MSTLVIISLSFCSFLYKLALPQTPFLPARWWCLDWNIFPHLTFSFFNVLLERVLKTEILNVIPKLVIKCEISRETNKSVEKLTSNHSKWIHRILIQQKFQNHIHKFVTCHRRIFCFYFLEEPNALKEMTLHLSVAIPYLLCLSMLLCYLYIVLWPLSFMHPYTYIELFLFI